MPVHAPVPGSGMPTNSSSATVRPSSPLGLQCAAALFALVDAKAADGADKGLVVAQMRNLRANR